MNSHTPRLKAIELSLTPNQTVLLWMNNALKGTYEAGAQQFSSPREAIACSISRTVRSSLKGQPDTVTEQAILQARQEADLLYNLVIEVNAAVQRQFLQRNREDLLLVAYLAAVMRSPSTSDLEEVRTITLVFVDEILLLDRAISQISAEWFGGQPILFSDCASKVKEQLELADEALEHFNRLAKELKSRELSAEEIGDRLRPEVDQQVSRWVTLARLVMLAAFGEKADFLANFNQLSQLRKGVPIVPSGETNG